MYSHQEQKQEFLINVLNDIPLELQQVENEAQKSNPEDTVFAITIDEIFVYHSLKIPRLR